MMKQYILQTGCTLLLLLCLSVTLQAGMTELYHIERGGDRLTVWLNPHLNLVVITYLVAGIRSVR